MSTLIIFGAGASAYCGTGSVVPSLPPLGNNLYEPLSRMKGMEGLKNISPDLQELFRNDFEKGFEQFLLGRDDPEEHPLIFMCGLAYYFTRFDIDPSHAHENLYVRLLNLLIATNKRYVFSTLNYEVLLERAAGHCGIKQQSFQVDDQPYKLADSIYIIKPHGACNLISKINNVQMINISITSGSLADTDKIEAWGLKEAAEVLCKFHERDFNLIHLPAISQYTASKHVDMNSSFIDDQREQFKTITSRTARIILIGVKLNENDKHIWEPISKSSANVGFVGLVTDEEKEVYGAWKNRNQNKRRIVHLHEKFEQCFNGNELSKNIKTFLART